MTRGIARAGLAFASSVLAAAAFAHHGVSSYRMDVVETLEGVVAEWSFDSPHTWLRLVSDRTTWDIEGAPPGWMSGQRFTPETLEAGDVVTIVYHPHRSKPQAGILMEVRRADGAVFKVNRPAALGGP
jgi:hypothetical protein